MFREDVQSLITKAADGTLSCKLTPEQREAIKRVQTSANTETQTVNAMGEVKVIDIASAMEARATRSDKRDTSGVYADELHMSDHNSTVHKYQCTVAKATNIATAKIVEASVWKIYSVLQLTHSTKGIAARNTIRTDWGDLFPKKVEDNSDRIIKATSAKDTVLSATVFPGDIRQEELIINAINTGINLKAKMIGDFLTSLKGGDEATVITAYRNINRSMLDNIFDSQYAAYIGRVDDSDPDSVEQYINALKDYRESLGQLGSVYLSSDTAEFGLNIRKLSIAQKVIWSNREKMAKVKRFGSGSYYISSNEDTGIGKVPTDPSILSNYMDMIIGLTDHCMALVENEARLENGYDSLPVPECPKCDPMPELSYANLLGITEDTERNILNKLQEEASKLAEVVCKRNLDNKNSANIERISSLMGR